MVWLPPEMWAQVTAVDPASYVSQPNAQDETPRAAPFTPKPEMRLLPEPPPNDRVWGEPYICCGFNLITGMKCGGWMQKVGRRFRYERRGRLWRRWECKRCGRKATDWDQSS